MAQPPSQEPPGAAGPRAGGTANSVDGASVTGPVVQAGTISGGVHLHTHRAADSGRAPDVPVPRQLIPGAAHFTDRVDDLAALDALRGAGPGSAAPVVVVTGAAGVGKTALTVAWLRRLTEDYPDGQLYADLRGYSGSDPVSPDEVLARFLRAVGVERPPAELAEKASLWRTVTADLRIAVMLDNALSAAQVRPLVTAAPDSLVAVTSRSRLSGLAVDGAAFHHLDVLAPSATVELLGRRLGADRAARERDAVKLLAELCAGLPLAVCVAAARLAVRPRQALTALVGAMSGDNDRLAGLRAGTDLAVQTALDASYQGLPAGAAGGYRQLGLLPAAVFGAGLVAAACALSTADARSLLDELVDISLLEELAPDRYRFHDLIRLHAAQRAAAEDPAEERADTVRRALDWYLWTATEARTLLSPTHRRLNRTYLHVPQGPAPFTDPADALAWLDAERLDLMAAVRIAVENGWDDTAWQLVDGMQPLWARLRPADMWVEAHRVGLAAAERAGRPEAVIQMLTTGAGGLCNTGSFDEAARWFDRALDLAREHADARAQAQALHGLGQANQFAGRPGPAADYYRRALALRDSIGHLRGAALSRLSLGELAVDAGQAHEAVELLTRARADLLTVPAPYDAARALAVLGVAHAASEGQGALAEQELHLALTELEACGARHWQARVWELMGTAAHRRGDDVQARDCFRQSLARYTPISPRDARRLADRLRHLDAG
ncbi:ATP-binding protein [Streptomyces sp. NPDC004031]